MTTNERDELDSFIEAYSKLTATVSFDYSPELDLFESHEVNCAWRLWKAARAAPPAAPQVSEQCYECTGTGREETEHPTITFDCLNCAGTGVAPSPQPEQTAAQEKAALWDFFNERLMSRSGIVLSTKAECQAAVTQWADAHDIACNYNTLSRAANERQAKTVMVHVAQSPLSLPAEYASAALKLKEIGYAWVQTDHGMQWVREELSDSQIRGLAADQNIGAHSIGAILDFARAVLATAKGGQL